MTKYNNLCENYVEQYIKNTLFTIFGSLIVVVSNLLIQVIF